MFAVALVTETRGRKRRNAQGRANDTEMQSVHNVPSPQMAIPSRVTPWMDPEETLTAPNEISQAQRRNRHSLNRLKFNTWQSSCLSFPEHGDYRGDLHVKLSSKYFLQEKWQRFFSSNNY